MWYFTKKKPSDPQQEVPERFCVSNGTLFFDRLMACVITGGGLLVIASVLGIFLFILGEVIPLFGSSHIKAEPATSSIADLPVTRLGSLTGLPPNALFLGHDKQTLMWMDPSGSGLFSSVPPLETGERITAARMDVRSSYVAVGTGCGRILLEGGEGWSVLDASADGPLSDLLVAGEDGVNCLVFATGGHYPKAIRLTCNPMTGGQSQNMADLKKLAGFPPRLAVPGPDGNSLLLVCGDSDLYYCRYDEDDEAWACIQHIVQPLGNTRITAINWIHGGESILIGSQGGTYAVFSIYPQRDSQGRNQNLFGKTKDFTPLQGSVEYIFPSGLDRCFLVGSNREIRLGQATTGETRIEYSWKDFTPRTISVNEELSQMAVIDTEGLLRRYDLDNQHAEASLKGLFGKVWYEGYPSAGWHWQSVGGTDSYEPKLSLMPLIFGTIKGTLYSLLFAVPVALLAAAYTAHFMPSKMKGIVKPVMEIMASLPSVVLGFLGALYFAPLMENRIPAMLCMLVVIPAATLGLGYIWASLPVALRNTWGKGIEYVVLLPVTALLGWFCWAHLGSIAEPGMVRFFCLVSGIAQDESIRTFPDLWRNGFGLAYEQRNSLVVGFIMGFAVIPVIFTIAEDALSNVPTSLIGAAEALGASRWQVFRTIVLPVAAAGIFSALMIGFGRAIGETMIVLMATGNTPVMDWNIFNGMRTLSANIATELPEAAEHSTHYRVLFLCAFVLFVMTFILNTAAEILRSRLRERFKII